jgi:hypothetical protein
VVKHILSSPCKTNHRNLLAGLGLDRKTIQDDESNVHIEFTRSYDGRRWVHTFGTLLNASTMALDLLTPYARLCLKSTVEKLHTFWINPRIFRRWKLCCDSNHGSKCKSISLPASLRCVRPKWLVDVWAQCLVPGSVSGDYIALSYVWGKTSFFKTTKDNVEILQRSGALSVAPLPKTIQHAMHYVEAMGERYIWIDCLCIVQDDMKVLYGEMSNMSAIFANATVTFIASNGVDVHAGLPGLRSTEYPRPCPQKTVEIGKSTLVWVRKQFHKPNPWVTRAWTFQEDIFSKRKLYLGSLTRWDCVGSTWTEGELSTISSSPRFILGESMLSSNLPDPTELTRLCADYNFRDLTYPEDSLNGFMGVMRVLCLTFKHGFVSGLPLACFSMALLWQPAVDAIRRAPTGVTNTSTPLPSWSWAGWRCVLTNSVLEGGSEYLKNYKAFVGRTALSVIITSVVKWFRHQNTSSKGVPIPTEWMDLRQNYLDTQRSPPAGWTKHPYRASESLKSARWPEQHIDREKPPRCFYKHHSSPDTEFWYPVPLQDRADTSGLVFLDPFISCRTRRVWLIGGVLLEHKPVNTLDLKDQNGRSVGAMRIHASNPDNRDGPDFRSKYCGQRFELIEISTGKRRNSPLSTSSVQEFCDAMWIEWKDGVAYRRGLGTVNKHDWEAQDGEMIDVMLG